MLYQVPSVHPPQPNRLTSAVTPIIPVQQPLFSLYLRPLQPGTVTPILGKPITQLFPVTHQDQPTYIQYPQVVPTKLPLQGAVTQSVEPVPRVSQPYLSPTLPLQPATVLPVQGPVIQSTITKFQDQPVRIPQPFQPGTIFPVQGPTIQQTFPLARQDQPVFAAYAPAAQPEMAKRTETFQAQWYVFQVKQPYFVQLPQIVPVVPRLEPPPPQPWYIFPVKQPYFVQLPQIPNVNPRLETIIEPMFTFKGPTIFQISVTSGTISIFKPGS